MKLHGSLVSILLTLLTVASGSADEFGTLLQQQRAAGLMSRQEELVLRVLATANPEALPEPYRSLPREPGKCGTATMWEAKTQWHELTAAQQEILAPYLARPGLPLSLTSPSGRFKIHYATSGANQTTNSFAWEAALAFDRAYEVEVVQMGYPPPPADNGIDGPEYDVYIQNISDYGWTYPEMPVPETPASDWTTYIVVDNDYSRGFYSKGLDGLRVTAAHEYFHAIHFGIREPLREPPASSDLFYYEVSATWMEDVVWDSVNDYYNYLSGFFTAPHLPFNATDGRKEYGMAVWNHFVAKRVGPEAIRDSWLYMRTTNAVLAIRQALVERGLTFEDALAEFAIWNMFTGSRADTVAFYPEGKHYPAIRLQRCESFEERAEVADSCRRLSTKYYSLVPQIPAPYTGRLLSSEPSRWRLSAAVLSLRRATFGYAAGGAATALGYLYPTDTLLVAASRTSLADDDRSGNSHYPFAAVIEPGSITGETPQGNTIVGVSSNPFRIGQEAFLTVLLHLETEQEVTMSVHDLQGRQVFRESLGRLAAQRTHPWPWDGRNQSGEKVASGVYLIVARFSDNVSVEKLAVVR